MALTRDERCAAVVVTLALTLCHPFVAVGLAQAAGDTAQKAAPTETVTLDPIGCWWRVSAGAVRVGEPFTLVLTCSVVESADTTVVPDRSKLDPGVLQMPPFEVVRGTEATDQRTGIHRLFQYEYTLRYAGEEFGRDISVPPLTIAYRVRSRTPQDAAVEGRERQYALPALTIRILSLVPTIAGDIRDKPAETFRETDARRVRANLLHVIAGVLYLVGAVVVVSGIAPVVRRRARRSPAAAALASEGAILRDRKSTRLNSSHSRASRMPSSA